MIDNNDDAAGIPLVNLNSTVPNITLNIPVFSAMLDIRIKVSRTQPVNWQHLSQQTTEEQKAIQILQHYHANPQYDLFQAIQALSTNEKQIIKQLADDIRQQQLALIVTTFTPNIPPMPPLNQTTINTINHLISTFQNPLTFFAPPAFAPPPPPNTAPPQAPRPGDGS